MPIYLGDSEVASGAVTAPAAGATIVLGVRVSRTAEYHMVVNLALVGAAPVANDYVNYVIKNGARSLLALAAVPFPQDIERILLHQGEELRIVALGAGTAAVTVIGQIILTPLQPMGT